MTETKEKERILKLPEPHRTIFEMTLNALIVSPDDGSITIKKITTEQGVTFSIAKE